MSDMTPKEHMRKCLIDLCAANGGPDAVADRAEVSAANLVQIISGTKLKSGNPRGIGPTLQKRLEKAYPGWAGLGKPAASAMTLEVAVQIIANSFADVPERTRRVALAILEGLVSKPQDAKEIAAELLELFAAGKRRAA